jgi:hypothetical protein
MLIKGASLPLAFVVEYMGCPFSSFRAYLMRFGCWGHNADINVQLHSSGFIVDFASVTNHQNQNQYLFFLNFADETIGTNTILPSTG